MTMTSEQIQRLYRDKLNAIIEVKQRLLNADKQRQIDSQIKRQKKIEDISAMLSAANLLKQFKESRQSKLMDLEYKEEVNIEGIPQKFKKYKFKEDRTFKEALKDIGTGENIKRLFPKGELEQTEGYKAFKVEELQKKASEELKKARETVKPEDELAWDEEIPDEDTIKDPDMSEFGEWDSPPSYPRPEVPIPTEDSFDDDIHVLSPRITTDDPLTAPSGVPELTFDSYTMTNMLRNSGINLPDGMSNENKIRIMSSLNNIVENGTAQDYKAFTETLKRGLDNPDMFPAVVNDLTRNTETTINRIQEGTYTPGKDLVYREGYGEAPVVDEIDIPIGQEEPWQEKYYGGVDPTTTTMPLRAPATEPDYAKIQAASDTAQDKQLKDLMNLQETTGKAPTVSKDLEFEKALKEMENLKGGGKLPKGVKPDEMIASAGPMSDAPLNIQDENEDIGLLGKVGKTFNSLNQANNMLNIGNVLISDDTSNQDKILAGSQALQIISDLAVKNSGEQAVSSLTSKAASDFISKKGLQESLKLGAKQAVGAVTGGIIGGYTMTKEAESAKESWEEGDYDEAILHGIGAVSGGLQTAGASMMTTGIGAPIGAVLFGLGTAGSAISTAGQFLEGLFEGGRSALEQKVPKVHIGRYLQSIRSK